MMAEPLKLQDLALKNVSSMLVKALVNLPEAASTQRVRDYFEGNLPGVVIRSIREQCMDLLNRKVELRAVGMGPPTDYCTILDGILDESLDYLEINSPLPTRASFTNLVSVIAHRCPKLLHLDLTFINNNRGMKLAVTPELIPQLGPCLENLQYLDLHSENHRVAAVLPSLESVLGIIGQMCPKLKELDMSDFCNHEKRSILALLMGEDLARALFPVEDQGWAKYLSKLRIPIKYLSPVCSSLTTLGVLRIPHYGAEYGFALRHLPKMDYWKPNYIRPEMDIPVYLIKALFTAEQEKELHSDLQAAFEAHCRLSAFALNLNVAGSSTLFSGPLPIEMMADVSVRDLHALVAIGLMCPQLTSLCFEDDNPADPADSNSLHRTIFEDFWSQIQLSEIQLKGVHPDLVKIILGALASSVKYLSLVDCRDVNLTDLWQCTELENLFIKNSTINRETSDPFTRTSSTFLPRLLEVSCCAVSLPIWSSWLESKSGLNKLRD